MKTHVIPLENHDDYISINDKIIGTKSPRILLVWPDDGRVRLLLSDLILIVRKAESVGSQIAVVSDEFGIVDLCKQINVSVFSSIPEAQKRAWRRPKKTRRLMGRSLVTADDKKRKELNKIKQDNLWKLSDGLRILIFLIGLFAFFGIIALFIPSATINLTPKTVPQQTKIRIWSNPEVQLVNLSGAVPLRRVPIVVEGSVIQKSTGVERVPTQFARGEVVFRNLTTEQIEVPAGTVVRTVGDKPVRFITVEAIVLEAGIDSEKNAAITAINAGVDGNIQAEQIQAVEGEIGGSVVVTNPTPISGGVDTKVTAPSVMDVQNAKNVLLDQLRSQVNRDFLLEEENADVFIVFDELTSQDEILIEKRNPEIGIASDQFQLTMEVRFMVFYLSSNDIQSVAAQTLMTNLQPGYSMLPKTLIISIDGDIEINPAADEIRLNVTANQQAMKTISENEILALVTGENISTAADRLTEFFEKVEVNIQPVFIKRLPLLAFRIKVEINENGI